MKNRTKRKEQKRGVIEYALLVTLISFVVLLVALISFGAFAPH